MATLAEIRAKLLEKEQRTGGSFQSDNAIYAFWNIPENSTATLRFLPDLDETNTFFWKERQMIRLSFPGIKGQDESRSVTVQVPCVEMWGDACPVHAEIRPWFKDPSLEDEGRKYWKKRSYIFQGFVTDNPWGDDTPPENPIRRFVINPSIYKIISAALMDPDFAEIPTDFEAGTDFKLTKTQKGQYADYTTSTWARRERSLDQTERDAIQTNGLFNLNDYMPKRPNNDEIKIIFEMFESSVAGELYDPERFGSYYTPQGVQLTNFNKSAPSGPSQVSKAPEPVVAETTTTPTKEKVETETETEGGEKPSADQILKMIRERKAQ
ncbi:uncharacterized protein METZ01_LOCUS160965 [marine metagenome]|uniref:Bacteriophage T4 Gp32 single-stranded DNA-binding domain-containing protein n=1 Tax=marine metagenome TaxID=408172 RepID=A0A382B3L2_9ZZZZ